MKTTKYIAKSFFLLLVTALFWAMPATTWGVNIDGIKYSLDSSKMTASATGYSGSRKVVTIPAVINDGGKDYTVTEIRGSAFFYCESLTSIEIPASVTYIGGSAFSGCTSLTSIEIPASVTEIRMGAFENCTRLASVTFAIGSQLKRIENSAFSGCNSLTSIEIPASVTSIGDSAFASCTGLTSIEIPAGVTEIRMGAFEKCTRLASVTFAIGSRLKSIGEWAFRDCGSLTSIEIPAGVTLIREESFCYCVRLTSIEIPASVTSIGKGAFEKCSRLASVTFAIGSRLKSIGEWAFRDCGSLTSIEIPAGVTIEKGAFNSHTKVTWAGVGLTVGSGKDPEKPAIDADFIEGKLVLLFTGTLEGSEDGKQWTAINATSPYTVEMTGGKKFFRAVGVQVGNELGGTGSVEVGKNFFIPRGINLEMIWVEPGTFMMGSPIGELGRWGDETQHQVTLTKGYWLGKYEVTQEQYKAVMGNNPSKFMGENLPVERVTWYNAMDFCVRLTEIERTAGRLPEGYEYTLPTEAQWEYACRAGTTTALNSGKNLTDREVCPNLDVVGWYGGNSDGHTHPVGGKQPNTWGFYDMHGNVYEWCLDWRGDYPTGSVTDPTGPATGSYRVIRGGSWSNNADYCRSAIRYYGDPSYDYNGGFRIALSPVQ